MSDLGGIGGALMLSEQISTDRLFDSYRRAREANSLALNDAAWRNQYNDLANRYNALVRDANQMANVQDRGLRIQDQHIAELRATNESMASELHRLREHLRIVRGVLDLERAMYREKHPEDFE